MPRIGPMTGCHLALALDLLTFQAASAIIDRSATRDGSDIAFNLPRMHNPATEGATGEVDPKAIDLPMAVQKSFGRNGCRAICCLPVTRSIGKAGHPGVLRCSHIAPQLASRGGDEPTAYNIHLPLTGVDAAAFWRPSKDNLQEPVGREELLTIGREVLGKAWARNHATDKKSFLVHHLDRDFTDLEKSRRNASQIDRLKSWLPKEMGFALPRRHIAQNKRRRPGRHNTHPRDIDRAMKADYSIDTKKRELQMEARAHIEVQRMVDAGAIKTLVSSDTICWIHHEFCSRLPDELLWVVNPDSGKEIRVIPGRFRDGEVQVGRHLAPHADSLPLFLNRFAEAYAPEKLSKLRQIIAVAASHHRLLWIHHFMTAMAG